MKSIRNIIFFIISQDYFQLTPLWKPQILLKQLYSFFITFRFSMLKAKPFDFLIFLYLFIAVCISFLQLFNYSIVSGEFGFFDLLKAQYPLFMAFSILIIYSPKNELIPSLFIKSVKVFVAINILLNVLITVLGLEDSIASSYDVFEFSYNQNIVVFYIFLQATKVFYGTDRKERNKHIAILVGLLILVNIPNFQRSRFIIIALVLFMVYFKRASLKIKLLLPALGAIISFLIFKTEKFSNILEAMVSKEDAIDPSLAGRFVQTQQILSTDFNSLYGFGFLNTKTKDNFFGEAYFHPSDTGLFGVYFNGGYLGILMFLILIIISIREIIRFRKFESNAVTISFDRLIIKKAAVFMTIFIIISGFLSASFFYEPMFLISYLFLIRCI